MIVICEECGKKYRIDPAKILGKAASFKCRVCAHVVVVDKPRALEQTGPSVPTASSGDPGGDQPEATTTKRRAEAGSSGATGVTSPAIFPSRRRRGIGLRARMMLLFAFVPLLVIAAAGAAYLWQMEKLTRDLTLQSRQIVNQLAEEKIADLSQAVAVQCKLYLDAHPNLSKYEFNQDMDFRAIAVQPVGKTGYTALYELPDEDSVWRTWSHVNPGIVGIDMAELRTPLGEKFDGFWKIFSGVTEKKPTSGYYAWQDKKGGPFRNKFMVCTPVAGTRYVVAATTYLDEFTLPMKHLEFEARELNARSRYAALVIIGLTLLVIMLVVTIYGHRLSGRIRQLTEVAERISIGDLNIDIEAQSDDEIGELSEAIARMQESVRLSIERLRRRR